MAEVAADHLVADLLGETYDGSTFEGGFADSVPAGVGVYTFMSNGLSQRGQFVDGVWKGETIVPVA